MRFGAMNFPVMPVLDEIHSFAKLGFDYLELAMDPPMAHYTMLLSAKKEIAHALKENGLGLVCHLPTFVSPADLTESLRHASLAEMQHSLDVAVELGAEKVVLHPCMVGGMGVFVQNMVKAFAFDFLAEMVAAAEKLHVVICLENMFPRNMLGVEPEDFAEIFAAFPSLKLTLDTGHANIAGDNGRRLKKLVEQFGNRLGHLHFSDNQGKRDDHLAVGKGTVDFLQVVRSLKATGYNDTLTLEVFENDRAMLVESREKLKVLFAD